MAMIFNLSLKDLTCIPFADDTNFFISNTSNVQYLYLNCVLIQRNFFDKTKNDTLFGGNKLHTQNCIVFVSRNV